MRFAAIDDAKAIMQIYNYEIIHGFATFDENVWTIKQVEEWIKVHDHNRHPLKVAEIDGKVVGYCSLSTFREKDAFKGTAELSLYVDHDYRGRNVGTSLLLDILNYAKVCTDLQCIVSVVTTGNAISKHLHEKIGFSYCGSLLNVGKKKGKSLGCDFFQIFLN